MMRVFQLNTFCGVKSTGRITLEIAKLVEREGGECRIGYGVPDVPKEAERFAYRIGTPVGRKLHAAMRKLLDAEGYGSFLATQRLIRELKHFHPDLIHMHNLHGCYLHLPSLFRYLKRSEIPAVWTLHDCWPFTGHCAYFDFVGCERWRTVCHGCPQLRSYPTCVGVDGSRRNYHMKKALFGSLPNLTLVAPCAWMKEPLSASFLSRYSVRVIPNGVNLEDFQPTASQWKEKYGLEGKKIVLAVASEWDERKGLRYLIDAARRLNDAYRFVIIGLTVQQIQALPEGMLGLEHTRSVKELAAWYTLADCFVNPTLEDNMPMVNLEALACGTPIAVFKTGGCPEAVEEGCGIVVEKGDSAALADAIVLLSSRKRELSAACRARAEGFFDCRRAFQAYIDLYKELCQ